MNTSFSNFLRLRRRSVASAIAIVAGLGLFLAQAARALQIPTYTSAVNDRFSSGYPTAPVPNTRGSFLGFSFDLSGVGWADNDSSKSFGMLSPKNFLATAHYGGATTLDFMGGDGLLHSYTQQSIAYTNYGVVFSGNTNGDTAIGTLTTPIKASDQVQSYAVLDMSSYVGASALLYGHGSGTVSPRLASTSISYQYTTTGTTPGTANQSYVLTSTNDALYEGGDSGSPAFIPWTDPTGAKQLTIMGDAAAVSNYNWVNFIQRSENIAALNSAMIGGGYALRWVANSTTTWTGAFGNSYGQALNWSGYDTPTATSYLGLSSANSSYLSLDLGGGQAARGVIFKPGTAGFTISNGTLSLDRGGLDNYDTHVQTLSNNFILTDHQFWDGHSGGFNVTGAINTNGKLLILQGSAPSTVNGVISGSGSFAKDGSGILTLAGANTYAGPTWLHNGALVANNTAGSATGAGALTVEAGTLAGFGVIAGNTSIAARAHVTGGNLNAGGTAAPDALTQSNNVLTFGGDLTLDGALDFSLGNLSDFTGYTQLVLSGTASHLSLGNDTSFTLTSSNFVGIGDPNSGLPFWNNSHVWTLIDVAGSNLVSGTIVSVSLGAWTQGDFSLTVNTGNGGNNVQLAYRPAPAPEPSAALLLVGGLVALGNLRRRRA